MLVQHNPDDYESISTQHTCNYHKRNPKDRSWPGCTCSGSTGLRLKKKPQPVEESAMKTAIEEIQARHEDGELCADYLVNPNSQMHADRAALLAILAQVATLPDKWRNITKSPDDGPRGQIHHTNCLRAEHLEATLKQTADTLTLHELAK